MQTLTQTRKLQALPSGSPAEICSSKRPEFYPKYRDRGFTQSVCCFQNMVIPMYLHEFVEYRNRFREAYIFASESPHWQITLNQHFTAIYFSSFVFKMNLFLLLWC